MVSVKLKLYSAESVEDVECEITLNAHNNSNVLCFENDRLTLNLVLKDIVDLEDFHALLQGKEKKSILHCTLKTNGNEYQGLRKVVAKNSNIVVSLGGVRIEFVKETKDKLLEVIESIKARV